MDSTFPLQLDELFFPVQEVRANPDHDPSGERGGTVLKQSYEVRPIGGSPGVFGGELVIECDRDQSRNPPYLFMLQAYMIVRVDDRLAPPDAQALAASTCFSMLVGAARERLLDLTSRAPWGRFMLGPVTGAQQG